MTKFQKLKINPLYFFLVISFLLIVVAELKMSVVWHWQYPRLDELSVTDHFSTDLGVLSQGAHRLAADLAYIQMLQYFGTPENCGDPSHAHDDKWGKIGRHDHFGTGNYPQLLDRGLRILRLDPYFHRAALEVGGALAFNLRRPAEGLQNLREAIARDPSFMRYRLYVGAILFKEEGKDLELIEILAEAIHYSDCPPMLENVLANLYKKYGEFGKAAQIYVHTIDTTPDPSARANAERNLKVLLKDHPEAVKAISDFLKV